MPTYLSPLVIRMENAQALGILCHFSQILVMYQELLIQIFLNYYLTLQRVHSYKWTRYYFFFFVEGTLNVGRDRSLVWSDMNISILPFFETTVHFLITTAN